MPIWSLINEPTRASGSGVYILVRVHWWGFNIQYSKLSWKVYSKTHGLQNLSCRHTRVGSTSRQSVVKLWHLSRNVTLVFRVRQRQYARQAGWWLDDDWSGGTTASPAERSLNSMEICHAKSRSLLSCLLHEHTIPEPLMGYVLRSPVILFRAFWCIFGFTDTVFKRNPWFSLSVTVCNSSTTHYSLANLGVHIRYLVEFIPWGPK